MYKYVKNSVFSSLKFLSFCELRSTFCKHNCLWLMIKLNVGYVIIQGQKYLVLKNY